MNVFSNSLEDGIDDFASTVVYKNLTDFFKPMHDSLKANGDDSAFNEAVSSSLSTLQGGLSMLAINYVSGTLYPLLSRRASMYFAYVVGSKLTKSAINKLKTMRYVPAKNLLKSFTTSSQERTSRLNIANNMISQVDALKLKKEQIASDAFSRNNQSLMGANSQLGNKSIILYTEKTKMGSWTSSSDDYNIYKRAVGKKLPSGVTWSKFHKKLNGFSQFAIDAEENVVNLAQVQLETMLKEGYTNVN